MYEVELKVRADHERAREALLSAGADPLGTVRQVDTYYEPPYRDFAATDEAFRVRREHVHGDTTAKITYKGPKIDATSKTREEHETTVADGETADAIFRGLGFEPVATVEKERHQYALREFTVTLDDVADLGAFLEVETDVETEADIEAAREAATALLGDLGLDPEDQIRTSYLGLLLDNEP
ncbi:Adenylate cyclase protein [Halorhabdus tiamatea SARL4B]|uniref:Adenylate cyclase CyaB n=1 Tax=Halorhabdus tiamatea SARL4B TaxID=1033806 RepID=F7PKD9_9EURY|nr:class IV adenylate cyclase [Halorhabdus tiamatea]ERJ07009.1 Adenylate cyclase protein [Halorhabdus tiamatea SARL4B]CCQ34779.1 adenylate cyclase CyaB [Halorhabdus tiamatea SARL4B]